MAQDYLFPATLMPDEDWWHELWSNPLQVLQDIGICSGMVVVDLCCGDGYFSKPLCELTNPGRVYGLELDAELIDRAQKSCISCENFHAILGDARDLLQYTDTLVDYVLIANTFHGVPEQLEMSRTVYSALKDKGCFTIINWHKKPRELTPVLGQPRGPDTDLRMQPEDVQQVVEPAGFLLEKIVDVGPYHYAAIFCKYARLSK